MRTPLAMLLCGMLTMQVSNAQASTDPCAQYYGKGYCTDYVNRKIGEKIRGDADKWRSNISAMTARSGDVAIFRSKKHVAYVERVTKSDANGRPTMIEISEMNWGPLDKKAPKECWVTTNFNRTTRRTISTAGLEFYRPKNSQTKKNDLNLPFPPPGGTNNTTPMYPNE